MYGEDPFAGLYEDPMRRRAMDAGVTSGLNDAGLADISARPAAPAPAPASRVPARFNEMDMDAQLAAIPDADLESSLASADQALQARSQGGGVYDVMGGQMQGSLEGDAAIWEQLQRLQPGAVGISNPKAPIVQRKYAEQRGKAFAYPDFEPEPFQPLPRYDGETDQEYAERMAVFEQADLQGQMETYERRRAEAEQQAGALSDDTRTIGRDPGAPGFEEAQRQGQEGVDAARIAGSEEQAAALRDAAIAQRDSTAMAVDAMEQQRERELAGEEAVGRIRGLRQEARRKLEAMPEIDRERTWKGLGLGTRIGATLAAMGQGWRGDAANAIEDAIDREIMAKENLYLRRRAEMDDIADIEADETDLYRFTASQLNGNTMATSQVMKQMAMEDAIAEIDARIAKAGTEELRAGLRQARVALEQSLRAQTDAMELEARTTPETIYRSTDTAFKRRAREELWKELGENREERRDLRKDYRGEASKEGERAFEMEKAGVEAEGKAAAARETERAKQEMDIKKAADEWGAVEKLIQDYRNEMKGNYHGVGAPLTGTQEQRIKTRNFKRALELLATSGFTGATATDRQAEQVVGMIEGDMWEVTDEAFDTRLTTIENIASTRRRFYQDQLGPATKKLSTSELPSSFRPDE